MSRRSILVALLSVALVAAVVAPAYATIKCYCQPRVGTYYQILKNDDTGAVVRAWVTNGCYNNHFVYVTVVANLEGGGTETGAYPVWLPCKSTRPVDISLAKPFVSVNKIIVTKLSTIW